MIGRLPIVLALCLSVTACGATRSALRLNDSDTPADPTAVKDVAATGDTPVAIVPAVATTDVKTVTPAFNTDSDFRIGTEDLLDVQVWRNCPDLCRTVPVRPDGKVSLPLVNDVQAAGLTPMELRQHLTQQLAEYLPSPEVSVIVREVHNFKVAVVGSVKMPGDYEIKSQATVLELIARAQGLTEFANRDKIVVLRQNGTKTERIKFNYRKVAEGDDQDNFYVRAGDIIVVP